MEAVQIPNFGYRKRGKLAAGDVFELKLPDGRLGYGIVLLKGGLKSGATPYVGIFRSAHEEPMPVSELHRDRVALAGWTMDGLVYHGRWKVIARNVALPNVPFPNFKVRMNDRFYVTDVEGTPLRQASAKEADLLDNQFSCWPMIFQDAFEALHGFAEWRDNYHKLTPEYAAERVL